MTFDQSFLGHPLGHLQIFLNIIKRAIPFFVFEKSYTVEGVLQSQRVIFFEDNGGAAKLTLRPVSS